MIGGGTNLVVADEGFDGVIVRYCAAAVTGSVRVEAGAELESLVDYTINHGLAGMHTMTRIPAGSARRFTATPERWTLDPRVRPPGPLFRRRQRKEPRQRRLSIRLPR